jgi:hypothetical protein
VQEVLAVLVALVALVIFSAELAELVAPLPELEALADSEIFLVELEALEEQAVPLLAQVVLEALEDSETFSVDLEVGLVVLEELVVLLLALEALEDLETFSVASAVELVVLPEVLEVLAPVVLEVFSAAVRVEALRYVFFILYPMFRHILTD